MNPKLEVIIASTRPGRVGLPVGNWAFDAAKRHGKFDVSLTDLAALGLPLLDEPNHPRFKKYTQEHTKKWSTKIDAADAFVFVCPEYNYSAPPSLLNALDYLFQEWNYKPVAFVSYGGISGGMRSVQMTKSLVTTLKMMPIPEAVVVQMVATFVKDGAFQANDHHEKAAVGMLDELLRWAGALSSLRTRSESV